jgi:WD40 repeat protein
LGVDLSQFYTITAVRWNPHRPMVFAVACSNGFIYVYDLAENMKLPVAVLEANELRLAASSLAGDNKAIKGKKTNTGQDQMERTSLLGLSFNHKQRDLLAGCDSFGKVYIWKLNWKLSNRRSDEVQLINNLANILSNEEK